MQFSFFLIIKKLKT